MNEPQRKSQPATGSWRRHHDSRTMSSEDFPPGWEAEVEIANVTIDEVADLQSTTPGAVREMPVLHFVGKAKVLPLNRTNARATARVCGSNEMQDWVGKRVLIFRSEKIYFGFPGALRIRRVGSPRPKDQAEPVAKKERTQPPADAGAEVRDG